MASKNQINIIIAAKDNASKVFGKIGGSLKSISGYAATATVGLIGGAGAIGAALLSLGSDAEEMNAKFQTVFGDDVNYVRQHLDAFADTVGRNKFELQGYAATLQDTLVPMGIAADTAADMSIDLVKLATDLSSFNNMPMDEALRRLQGTLVGAHENALAFGVVINENTIKAELAKQGWDNLTGAQLEAAKVQARINLLMEGTTAAQGDAERTADSFANRMRALKSTITETATAMGLELLPAITPMLAGFTTWVQDVGPRATEIFTNFATTLSENLGPAALLINDALTRIGASLGLTSDEVTGTDVLLKGLKLTLDAIVITVQAVAVGFQLVASAIETAAGLASQASTIFDALGNLSIGDGLNAVAGGLGVPGSGGGGAGGGDVYIDGEKVGKISGAHQGASSRGLASVGGYAYQ